MKPVIDAMENTAAPPPHALNRPKTPAVRRLPLHLNFAWTLAGNIVYAGCGWAMLMAIAKLATHGSAQEQVGQYALGLAVIGPVVAFSNLNLRAVQATDAVGRFPFGAYFALRLITNAVAFFAIAAIAFSPWYFGSNATVIVAAGIAAMFEALSDVIYGRLQQHERLDRIAISMMLKAPLGMGAMTLAFIATGDVAYGFLAVAAVRALVLIGYDIPCALWVSDSSAGSETSAFGSSIRPIWDARLLKTLALLSLPLGLSALLVTLNINVPRYFIEGQLGKAQLGVFAAMMYIMQVGGMIVTALGQSATPTLARHFAAGRTGRFSLLLAGLVAIGAAIGSVWFLGAVFFGREILRLVYTAEFAEYAGIFVIAAIVGGINFVSAFLAFGMNAVRAFKAQMALQLLALLAIAVGCVILVPRYGLAGAIIAVGVSSAVQAMGGLLTCLLAVFRSLPRARLAASQNDESGPCPPSDEDRSGADPSASLMSLGDAV